MYSTKHVIKSNYTQPSPDTISMIPNHEQQVITAVTKALQVFRMKGFTFKIMNRTQPVKKNTSYIEGHTSLQTKTITIDIYTARLRKPKKISAILAVLAHEVAHHQKPPYRQQHKGRLITRMHYPEFYKQVTKNIKALKKHRLTRHYYS